MVLRKCCTIQARLPTGCFPSFHKFLVYCHSPNTSIVDDMHCISLFGHLLCCLLFAFCLGIIEKIGLKAVVKKTCKSFGTIKNTFRGKQLNCQFGCWHPILECWFKPRLLHFQLSFLLTHLGRQQMIVPNTWELAIHIRGEVL